MQVGEANAELQKVTDLMGEITHKGQSVNIKGELNPTKLLPGTAHAPIAITSTRNTLRNNI